MVSAETPPFDPVAEPAVLSALTPEFGYPTGELPALFLTDHPPIALSRRAELATVGTVLEIPWYPAAPKLVLEEMLEGSQVWRLVEQVIEMFLGQSHLRKSLRAQCQCTAIQDIQLIKDTVQDLNRQLQYHSVWIIARRWILQKSVKNLLVLF